MGKRYGRNQKRRHRERIAALERDLERCKSSHESTLAELDRITRRHRDVIAQLERLTPHSVLLPVKRTNLSAEQLEAVGWELHRFDRPRDYSLDQLELAAFRHHTFRVDMYRVRVWIEELVRDGVLEETLHVMARDSQGRWVYTCSWKAMDRVRALTGLQEHVCGLVAQAMAAGRQAQPSR